LLSLCLIASLLLSFSSCMTTKPIHLPEEELLKLFQIKEQAQTDGRFVKRKIEKILP
jgi:hypothetical protein